MAAWNRLRASGEISSAHTEPPPADWPAMVTLRGSPPKAGDVRCTQRKRLELVEQPAVVRGVRDESEAVEAESVGDRHGDHPVPVEGETVVPGARGRPGLVATAVDPDQDGKPGLGIAGRGGEHVDVQCGLAGQRRLGDGRHLSELPPLRGRPVTRGGPDVVPAPAGTGAPNRFGPTGGSANGMPRKAAERG